MKRKTFKTIVLIIGVSFIISLIGFVLDLGERVPDVWVNISETIMMTILISILLSVIYLVIVLVKMISLR